MMEEPSSSGAGCVWAIRITVHVEAEQTGETCIHETPPKSSTIYHYILQVVMLYNTPTKRAGMCAYRDSMF